MNENTKTQETQVAPATQNTPTENVVAKYLETIFANKTSGEATLEEIEKALKTDNRHETIAQVKQAVKNGKGLSYVVGRKSRKSRVILGAAPESVKVQKTAKAKHTSRKYVRQVKAVSAPTFMGYNFKLRLAGQTISIPVELDLESVAA